MLRNRDWELIKPPLLKLHQNKCLRWVLPCLNIPGEQLKCINHGFGNISAFEIMIKFGFCGIYWNTPCLDENYKNCLFLIFSPSKEVLFGKFPVFHEFYTKLSNFREVTHLDFGVICLILNVGVKYQEVIRFVKKGQYSKISNNLAAELYTGFRNGGSYQKDEYLIVKKSEIYRKKLEEMLSCTISESAELESKPNPEEEIFRYENRIKI